MKQIIITSQNNQIRAAVLEQGKLVEVLDDSERESRLAGSIFKGKVMNVVPGMQAAFVDIGLGRNAFLYVGDVLLPEDRFPDKNVLSKIVPTIENFLQEGQEIVVQVTRDPVGNKGARVTTNLTLPGRFTVLLPGKKDYLGISRKIVDEEKKQHLLKLAQKLKPEDAGIIIRTLAAEAEEKEIDEDIQKLCRLQKQIEEKGVGVQKGLLYSGNDVISRLLRDIIDDSVEEIIVDCGDLAQSLRENLRKVDSAAAGKVWTNFKGSLFDYYRVNQEIKSALQPKVALASGAYLVIEPTEALTVIDVNSGKYTGKRILQDTILTINLEAALEIGRQIRLRNLSGIIIIDFIDMEKEADWQAVIDCLNRVLAKEKTKSRVLGPTKLGLVEVTRKKEGQTLAARYTVPCQECTGKGWIWNSKALENN
ncbi:MAG: Rne/Rng family ribonuclease [Peptococcaceae bacterium]|nr:Rne/Rng family ribonuclease [Peptococcaceae bacterium]